MAGFRLIRNGVAASALAAAGYMVVMTTIILPLSSNKFDWTAEWINSLFSTYTWSFFFLAGLAIFLRWLKPVWLGLMVGAMAGGLMSSFAIDLFFTIKTGGKMSLQIIDMLPNLASAISFAGVFWAGLQLPWAKLKTSSNSH